MASCKSCGAPIDWARSERGKAMPVEPHPGGNVLVSEGIATVVDDGRGDHVSHFATCPHANQHRRTARSTSATETPDASEPGATTPRTPPAPHRRTQRADGEG